MEKKEITRIGVGVAVVLAAAVLASFALRIFASDVPELVLPSPTLPVTGDPGGSDPFAGNVLRVEVTTFSVQSVIATLTRPAAYSQEMTLESFWTDAEGETHSAVTRSQVWVDGGCTRIDMTLPNGQVSHRIVTNDTLYLWYGNETDFVALPADSHSADVEQHIPTYEDVLALPAAGITAAGYEPVEDVDCVYVEAASNAMGYREKFWISVDSGLLTAAETWNGDRLLYRMSSLSVTIPGEGGVFRLPDGTLVGQAA